MNENYRGFEDLEYRELIEEEAYVTEVSRNNRKRRNGRKNNRLLKTLCLCLAFLVLGTGIGMAGTKVLEKDSEVKGTEEVQEADVEQKDASTDGAAVTPEASNIAVTGNEMSASEIYALACQQVVGITTEVVKTNAFGQASAGSVAGTGFFISEDGYIATNYHVVSTAVSGNYPITVIGYDGETYEAEYIGGDSENDIALLKIEASGLNAATFADSNDMAVGEDVYVIGNALGELSYTLTSGLVSAMDRQITPSSENGETATIMNMFQIDAAVNSGNSGGPVYNSKGQVIGIVTAKYASTGVEGIGFAIPINDAGSMLSDIKENGYVSGKPSMGITASTVESSVAQMYDMPVGVYVVEVTDNGAARAAGIQPKDIITKLDDTEITSISDLNAAMKQYSAGETAQITVYRSGAYQELELTFDEKDQLTTSAEVESNQPQDQTQPQSPYNNQGTTWKEFFQNDQIDDIY